LNPIKVVASNGTEEWTLRLSVGASGDEGLERALLSLYAAKFYLMCAKHRKYGPGNIAAGGRSGILTRIKDKIARIESGHLDFADELYGDALLDLPNYADILYLWENGDWPNVAEASPICRGCGKTI
jgi:hypothetical protein